MDDFKERRRKGIGGTDISNIMGIGSTVESKPYKSAYEVYIEKVEGTEKDLTNNEKVTWGILLEDVIANRFQDLYLDKHGESLYKPGTITHPTHPFLIANPDRLILSASQNRQAGLEIKTAGEHLKHLWGDSGSSSIPYNYYMQISHYMLVCNVPIWHVAVLIGGQEFRTYTFERDKQLEEMIIEAATKFWKEHVEKRIPPPIDYTHSGCRELIKRKYKLASEERVSLPDEYIAWKDSYLECKKKAKYWSEQAEEAQTVILEAMKTAGIGKLSDGSSFLRKLIRAKEYTVAEREYIRLDFKRNVEE